MHPSERHYLSHEQTLWLSNDTALMAKCDYVGTHISLGHLSMAQPRSYTVYSEVSQSWNYKPQDLRGY